MSRPKSTLAGCWPSKPADRINATAQIRISPPITRLSAWAAAPDGGGDLGPIFSSITEVYTNGLFSDTCVARDGPPRFHGHRLRAHDRAGTRPACRHRIVIR